MIDMDKKDTINLIHDADYCVLIDKGLYWVPVNHLGKSHYYNGEMNNGLKSLTPEEKKQKINSVYEAVQLFQISQFTVVEDTILLEYEEYIWEFHKPGYYAVLSNDGCCSSIAAWLNFLVGENYPSRGYIFFSRPDGSGHIMNYFFHESYYYIVDLSTMTYDRAHQCCRETGSKADYVKSKYAVGCCFKTADIGCFIRYHSRIQKYHNITFQYFLLPPFPSLPPIVIDQSNSKIIYGFQGIPLNVSDSIQYEFRDPPKTSPNWNI